MNYLNCCNFKIGNICFLKISECVFDFLKSNTHDVISKGIYEMYEFLKKACFLQ